jgi:hypothetical protein
MSVRLLLTDEAWEEIFPILATLKSRAGSPLAPMFKGDRDTSDYFSEL